MCLIVLAFDCHPLYRLVVAANRDELHQRAAAPVDFWDDAPHVLAGRDLEAGGTWLGISRDGRFAAITNVREPGRHDPGARSRGRLVADFLCGATPPGRFARELDGIRYNGFNLLIGEGPEMLWVTNRGADPTPLPPGVHGLSNSQLDTPWPKVRRGTEGLRELVGSARPLRPEELFELLDDTTPAADSDLPDTGLPREWERVLSPPRIVHPRYGTRSSTALLVGHNGCITVSERTFGPAGDVLQTRTIRTRTRDVAASS